MKKVAHAAAGSVALLLVLSFLTITLLSELSMDAANVIVAKNTSSVFCFWSFLPTTSKKTAVPTFAPPS